MRKLYTVKGTFSRYEHIIYIYIYQKKETHYYNQKTHDSVSNFNEVLLVISLESLRPSEILINIELPQERHLDVLVLFFIEKSDLIRYRFISYLRKKKKMF